MRLSDLLRRALLLIPAAGGLLAVCGPGCQSGTAWGGAGCNDVCPGAELCDTALGCVECQGNGHCGAAQPFCVLGSCRECELTPDCGAGQACYPREHVCKAACEANGDCAGEDKAPFCNLATGACVGCVDDGDCGDQPFCNPTTGACAECLGDGDCGVAEPFCDPGAGECRSCIVDAHCGANQKCDGDHCVLDGPCTADNQCPGDLLCHVESGECVECLLDGDCKDGNKPFCSPTLDKCVECVLDTDCGPDKICGADDKCN
jgi:hypothetical protein